MKYTMKKMFSVLFAAVAVAGVCTSCQDDTENFENLAHATNLKVKNILLKGTNDTDAMVIQTKIAKPETFDVNVSYKVDASLVGEFNNTYGEKAIILPAENYEIADNKVNIAAGTVKGNDVLVNFKGLTQLNRDLVYVLPITVAESNIGFLNSTRTSYAVIKGAALINTVGNITKNYLRLEDPSAATSLNGMRQLTVEALVRVEKFEKLISTLMGIEGKFLLRFGDGGVPDCQMQLACTAGREVKVTDAGWQIATNQWVHIALTYDADNSAAAEFYVDGVKKGATQYAVSTTVNWGSSEFFVGKSYDNNRWLEGDICEVRVWNRVLTADEINAKDHFYVVAPDSDGLAAYWKFDEGAGLVIADHSGNGCTLVANSDITWTEVSLPK